MRPALTYEEQFIRDLYSGLARRKTAQIFSAPVARIYSAAKSSRLTSGWGAGGNSSADTEIISSLRELRARSRELVRDAAFAKRAKMIVQNNVVGSGIGLQCQVKTTRGDLNRRINSDIESEWSEWCRPENCHTGGALHFADMERQAIGQVFEAGEIFFRIHRRAFGASRVPLCLEIVEPERVVDEFQPAPVFGERVRLGVEQDAFGRPLAYWVRAIHPGETRLSPLDIDRFERVPAEDIIHMRIVDRWPQTRGVPWMHAAMRKLNDTDGYTEAEIVRARAQAMHAATIETEGAAGDLVDPGNPPGAREVPLEPGMMQRLAPGEKMTLLGTNSPNPSADPFLRFMLREIAAAIGVSYESISRDYSQSNYSSSRLALLDDRDLWRVLQIWFIRSLRERVHREFVQAAVLARAITTISVEAFALAPLNYFAARYKPRGWSWVDPTKEVEAYKEAIRAGFTTRTDVISQTANGRDIEDIDEERAQELKNSKEAGLLFDTDPDALKADIEAKRQPPAAPKDNGDESKKLSEKQEAAEKENAERMRSIERIVQRNHADQMKALADKQMVLNLGDTIVNNAPAQISVPVDARSTVTIPEREVKIENRHDITVPEREVRIENKHDITVPEREVRIENRHDINVPEREVRIENKHDITVPERELHFHAEKKPGKRTMRRADGTVIGILEG